MAFQVPWGIAQEPEGTPWPGRGPGHLGPGDIETIIDDGCDNRRQPADPFNFPLRPMSPPQRRHRSGLRPAMVGSD